MHSARERAKKKVKGKGRGRTTLMLMMILLLILISNFVMVQGKKNNSNGANDGIITYTHDKVILEKGEDAELRI